MEVQEAASRLLACPRLSREREAERQRAIQRPLAVAWKETVEDGQVYISISSDESDSDSEVEATAATTAAVVKSSLPSPMVKAEAESPEPEIVTIESSDDEEEEAEVEEEEEVWHPKRRTEEDLEEKEDDQEYESEDEEEEEHEEQRPVVQQRQPIVWEQQPNGVRKRRLGEEDAAFLLFYGDRESPSADILRLIVELIECGVGATDLFLSRYIKYVLWCRLNTTVEAGLASERLVQSEWTKIVFSCPVPSHRRRSGPMPRPDLLPRPITITVRPLQLARKQPRRRSLSVGNGTPTKEIAAKNAPPSPRATAEEKAIAMANTLAGKGARSNFVTKSPKKKAKSPASKQKRTYNENVDHGNGIKQSPEFLPRKHRRRNGAVGVPPVTPRQVVRAKSSSGQSISQKLMEPLPYNCRTLGENRSLPIGWRDPETEFRANYMGGQVADRRTHNVQPVEVNPMLQMTADEIAQHIQAVRREGIFTSFEKVSDLLLKLMADPRNRHGVFNSPVDPVALELPTYTTIVKHPMDLGTIKHNLAAGEYLELEDFIADVRLVFENAMLFNPITHYVHVDAEVLLKRFNEAVRAEQTRQCKRQRVQHACLVCRGNTCIVCSQQCLPVAQPHLQCSAGCSADIRKGSVYFSTKDGTRVWCQKCRTRMARDRNNSTEPGADDTDALLESLVRKKCEPGVEPWVKCDECDRWLHQVCGLYNPVVGAYRAHEASQHESGSMTIQPTETYVCPLCRCRRKRSTPPPESPMRKILHLDPDENAQNNSCLNIPSCELSLFIQDFLRRGLENIGEQEAAQTLHVRALSFPGERMTVPEGVVNAFDENAQALGQMRPGVDTSAQRVPAHISYLSRGLYLFQKHEGMEVCLFTIYAQEFGDECELEANRRSVYVAYLDSVRYLKPASARTAAYHLIMLAYFDYVRRHGFSRVHIWSCPPQKRISYVFWCRPPFQKTPSAEHLRRWYNSLLEKAKEQGIVRSWTNMYDQFFSDSACRSPATGDSSLSASFVSVKEENGVGVSTRGTTVQSVNPDELMWPANQLPPIFDGDIIPSELERILGRIVSRNEKKERASKNKKMAVARAKNGKVARAGGKFAVGNVLMRIKEEAPSAEVSAAPQVNVKLRELFNKLQFAVQRLKNDLLVVELEVDGDDEAKDSEGDEEMPLVPRPVRRRKPCRPEELVPSWCRQVPRFFGSRFMFHQLCSYAGYQFDSLRRAKHSTMMMLHHFFNEHVVQLNVFCRECSLLITRAEFWSCRNCERYALCDSCYRRLGKEHRHAMDFGPAPMTTQPPIHQPVQRQLLPPPQQQHQVPGPLQQQFPAPQRPVNICELS